MNNPFACDKCNQPMKPKLVGRILFKNKKKHWKILTDWDKPNNLKFAIKQLEKSEKPYSIETKKNLVRIWTD